MSKGQLCITTSNGRKNIDSSRITNFIAKSNYTLIFFSDHQRVLIAKTLQQCQDFMDSSKFLRIHRSHLVNKDYIKNLNSENIELLDGTILQMSRRKKKNITILLGATN